MSELAFLIELILKHKLQTQTKLLIAERIREVEMSVSRVMIPQIQIAPRPAVVGGSPQAPSTQALLEKHAMQAGVIQTVSEPAVVPVEAVAQNQATAAAMASRNRAIAESISGKTDKTTGRPRKF